MRYTRFEELPVWQAAIEFALKIFEFTEQNSGLFRGLGDTKINSNAPLFQFQITSPKVLSAARPPN